MIIFALFAIQQLLDYSSNIYSPLDTPITDVVISALTLAILVLFFVAIVRTKLRLNGISLVMSGPEGQDKVNFLFC